MSRRNLVFWLTSCTSLWCYFIHQKVIKQVAEEGTCKFKVKISVKIRNCHFKYISGSWTEILNILTNTSCPKTLKLLTGLVILFSVHSLITYNPSETEVIGLAAVSLANDNF